MGPIRFLPATSCRRVSQRVSLGDLAAIPVQTCTRTESNLWNFPVDIAMVSTLEELVHKTWSVFYKFKMCLAKVCRFKSSDSTHQAAPTATTLGILDPRPLHLFQSIPTPQTHRRCRTLRLHHVDKTFLAEWPFEIPVGGLGNARKKHRTEWWEFHLHVIPGWDKNPHSWGATCYCHGQISGKLGWRFHFHHL